MTKLTCSNCQKEFELDINKCPNCCDFKLKNNSKKHAHPLICSDCKKTYSVIPCYHLH